ncbi:gamma-glutamyl-gamma-aminobutyrate hydrolase family protein [Alkalibacillus aidingensis]|uniref:gamma-glutamyl-gamma-aminobutyrate hydrolase family protein n=1 Tax=Alkalibacillus aidingensis TaxID=2747607 RepID=UPI00166133DA|nr:gamma-glutamyl-gamma-aminobutyrate hydrolase family protein [Alkalibacillus aidingensis]
MTTSKQPVIGLTCSSVNHNNIPSFNIHKKLVDVVIKAGGVPVVIPTGKQEMTKVWVSHCDGVILTGGEDIDPNSYGDNPSPQIKKTNKKRDQTEMELVRQAMNQKKPILGLCRGAMILNVGLGGSVIQDIETNIPNAINHYQQAERPEPTHDIRIDQTSRLYQILGSTNYQVNSFHHQSIDQLSSHLKSVAEAPDGVIEAVEVTDLSSPVVLGVQWHPEEMAGDDLAMQRLFDTFVIECKN